MADKSIKKNFIYNVLNQVVQSLGPLVVTPYISRVLGVENIGLYSFAESIVSYFLLFAILGTATYGQRAISYVQGDINERSKAFWEVFIIRLVTTFITLGAYAAYIFILVPESQFKIFLILLLNIINVIFDITWFLQGLEEFGKISIRSIFFRVLSVVLIFVFVKEESNFYLYIIFMVAYALLGNISLWLYLPKFICKVKGVRPFKDIKTVLQLFLPTIAVQIYTVLDKSMIGWLSDGYVENGYYEQAEKLVKTALVAVTALGVVTIPRIARTFKEGDMDKVQSYIYRSYRYVWLIALPLMFGLISVADFFVPIYYGAGYDKCKILIPIFSALLVIIGLSNVSGIQLFVPIGKQNVLTFTVVIGAVVNFILNLILIPKFASIGATCASVAAEFVITVIGFIYIRKKKLVTLKNVFLSSWKYLISGGVMCGILFLIKYFLPVTLWSLVVLVVSGMVIYLVMLLILRDSFIFEIFKKGIEIFKKPKKNDAPGDGNFDQAE